MRSNYQKGRFGHEHLAHAIHEATGVPKDPWGNPVFGRKIVRIFIQAIKDALLRGETVSVRGFGKFKIVDGRRNRIRPFITVGAISDNIVELAPKRRVIFIPSYQLRAMLNSDSPNYKERRAMSIWPEAPTGPVSEPLTLTLAHDYPATATPEEIDTAKKIIAASLSEPANDY